MIPIGRKSKEKISAQSISRITSMAHPLHFPDLWQWRYLIYLFVKRDFVVYFQQTLLGPLWYLIAPLASTVVLSIIFGRIAKLPTDAAPPFLFYLLGSVVWGYFSDCFTRTSQSLAAHAREFDGAAFPRLTVPTAAILSALIQFVLQLALFLGFYLWYLRAGMAVSINPLLTIPALVQLALTGMGGGMLVAALTVKYRDLSHLVGFGLQLLYFCTPLVYPLSMVPRQWRGLYCCNPLTTVIEMFRRAFFGTTTLSLNEYCIGMMVTLLLFAIGLVVFNKVEKTFIDTI
jgi:lipopolysaccharide transport system permease protein